MSGTVDRESAEQAIAAFLEALGHDTRQPELAGTPARVVQAFSTELLRGSNVDLRALVLDGSEPSHSAGAGLVVVRGISAVTICPHHLLPGLGTAVVAYLPGARLVGLGAIARLVDACSRRLTLQEHIGDNVVKALVDFAGARGAYCQLELLHTCLAARGAEEPEARLVTVARAGELATPQGTAELALALSTRPGRAAP